MKLIILSRIIKYKNNFNNQILNNNLDNINNVNNIHHINKFIKFLRKI